MRYFMDTEFVEAGNENPIRPISIAIVAEDGREFYAETIQHIDYLVGDCNPWVVDNVLPHLQMQSGGGFPFSTIDPTTWLILDHPQYIGDMIVTFTAGDDDPRFYAWYADYDWVVFCQLFGRMVDLPKGFPMYCRDVKQMADMLGVGRLPDLPDRVEHHALADARDCLHKWRALQDWNPGGVEL